ncbi:hypothetical protein KC320_g62 [Hortaea werneckii]|nr:hypothetical protein KC320_g62 [Hortaea werneckii]
MGVPGTCKNASLSYSLSLSIILCAFLLLLAKGAAEVIVLSLSDPLSDIPSLSELRDLGTAGCFLRNPLALAM